MAKRVIAVLAFAHLMLGTLSAQGNDVSPYSLYGYGDRRYNAHAIVSAMGGVGANFFDGTAINTVNPASYVHLRQTTYEVGIHTDIAQFKTHLSSDSRSATYISQVDLALPLKRSAFLLGFLPFSATGYNGRESDPKSADAFVAHDADGELNAFVMGYAYQITQDFSLGIHVNYVFGNKTNDVISGQGDAQLLTDQRETSHTKGFYFTGGAIYTKGLKDGKNVNIGATYSLGAQFQTEYDRLVYTFRYAGDGTGRQTTLDTISPEKGAKGTLDLPFRAALALGLSRDRKFGYGAQADFENFQNFKIDGKRQPDFKNSVRLAAGGYWIPKYSDTRNYFSRVTYRFGTFYEGTYLHLNGKRIRDGGVSFGLGLPMGIERASTLNLGLILGRRGTVANRLVRENYMNLRLCLSFGERWFRKRKYD
ncbi:MAG: hypothetical protein V6Z82_01845 [Flavobacteriales bacterium]